MEKVDNNGEIGSKEDEKKGSDCEDLTQRNEVVLASSSGENPDSKEDEGDASEKEQEKASQQLDPENSPGESLSTSAEKDISHQVSDDSQSTIDFNSDQNAHTNVGTGSISLSTLISTIIKGTVVSMEDVGKDKQQSLVKTTTAVSSREIVSSSELQDGALSSATDNQTSTTDIVQANVPVQDNVLQEKEGEIQEEPIDPVHAPAAGSYRGGRGRRGRMQHRFTMAWNKQHEEANEVAQTKTIDTDRGRIYQCVSCNVSFNYEQDMRMHLQTHLRPRYFCPVCSRRFLNQSTLERHVGTHDQSKPHVCSICSQGFRIKSNLNRHYQRIHNTKADVREPRQHDTEPIVSMSQTNMATQDDHLADSNSSTPNVRKAQAPISHSYSSPYPYRSPQVSTFAAPRNDLHPNLHYEPTTVPHEPNSNVVSSTERIADLQSNRSLEYEQSPYLTDHDQIGHSDPSPQGRAADENESYEHLFFSRYPDIESAVDAIRRIETERLFHQELLLEELKLRRKYGLPSTSVLDDLKKEIVVNERIGDLDFLVEQGNDDFDRLNPNPNGKQVRDPTTLTESLQRPSPHPQSFEASFQRDRPSRGDGYLMAELQRRQENEEIASRSIPSDLLHRAARENIYESQASRQLRRLSGYNSVSQPIYKPSSERGRSGDFNFASDVQLASSQIPTESSDGWSASQRLKALTPPFGRSRRGRRKLAAMSGESIHTFPPKYPSEPGIRQQRFSAPPRMIRSTAPLSQVVHHRPMLPQGLSPALPQSPRMRPPQLPFRAQRNPSLAKANLPPPPDYRFPSSPRYSEPKRFRPTLQQHKIAELRNTGDFSDQQESDSLESLRATLGTRPSQPTRASPGGNDRAPNGSNPFTMSGPPNQAIKPVRRASAPPSNTLHTSSPSEDCTTVKDIPTTSKQTNCENMSVSPLDLSHKT